jgi:hypothetical protein
MRTGRLIGCALFRRSGGAARYAVGPAALLFMAPMKEEMRRSRYVVSGCDGGWQVRRANSRVTETFPSKAQALCAAIELTEKDGARGDASEVLVRHAIASSRSGSTAKTCIPTTQQDPLAESSQDDAALNVANRTLRSGQND